MCSFVSSSGHLLYKDNIIDKKSINIFPYSLLPTPNSPRTWDQNDVPDCNSLVYCGCDCLQPKNFAAYQRSRITFIFLYIQVLIMIMLFVLFHRIKFPLANSYPYVYTYSLPIFTLSNRKKEPVKYHGTCCFTHKQEI